ncbi:type II secretion system protein [Blautia wexlerae]|nr:type II secretion system protein [Blautia wexlerae]
MDRKKKKNSNAGMTLLEVIIAVSIFSISAIVLLQSFVTSSRINKKSNTYLEATSTAQNVMEEIKAKRFQEVALAFNYPVDLTTNSSRFTFLDSQLSEIKDNTLEIKEIAKDDDGNYINVRKYNKADGDDDSKVTASVISHDSGKTYKFNANDSGKYYYSMSNVKNLNETFDVLVEFDGGDDTEYRKKTISNNEYGKNDYLSPNIAKLDTKKNAFLIMEKDWCSRTTIEEQMIKPQHDAACKKWQDDLDAWKEQNTFEESLEDGTKRYHPTAEEILNYKQENPEPSELDYEDVYAHTRRILKIKLEKSGGGGINVKARYILCAYDYTKANAKVSEYATMSFCPCGGESANLKDGEEKRADCFCTVYNDYTTFYSSENEDDLQNIYIFYYPNYNSQNIVKPLDEIYFDNTDIKVKEGNYPVNLYVTKQRDEKNNEPTSAQEMQYKMSLTIQESSTKPWSANMGLYKASTTLLTNLDYDISNIKEIPKRINANQMKLTYTDTSNHKTSGYSAKNILSYNGLDNRQAEDRIYNAVVKVYKQGAAQNNFPERDMIVSLDGAKEN